MHDNILVIRFGSLGDLILTSAPVLNLKINFPNSKLYFLTKERYKDIAGSFDGVDEVIAIPENCSMPGYVKLLLELDKIHFKKIIDLHGNARSWIARKMLTADQSIKYYKRRAERERIVRTNRIPLSYPHTIDNYNDTVLLAGGKIFCRRPIIKSKTENISDPINKNIVIAPGASYKTKQYPLEKFFEIATELNRKTNIKVDWVITNDDLDQTNNLFSKQPDWLVIHADKPISDLIPIFNNSLLVISNDSGMMHLASAVDTPVIALFGPTHPSLGFAPRGMNDQIIEVDEECRPCSLHGKKECSRSERFCFTKISVEDVLKKALEQIEVSRERSKAIFVDRDGTLIVDKHYLSNPDDVELIDRSAEALQIAIDSGYKVVVVSNQSGVARQYHSIEDVEKVNGRMIELLLQKGVELDAVYFCPHHTKAPIDSEYALACICRKPAAGMPEEAAKTFNLDLRKSITVGDSLVDYNLGRVIGGQSCLVRTGYGKKLEKELIASNPEYSKDVFDNLYHAVTSLIKS